MLNCTWHDHTYRDKWSEEVLACLAKYNKCLYDNKYFDFSRSPEGECTFRRLDGRPPFGDLVIPITDMETLSYVDPPQLGQILVAGRDYALEGSCVLPPSAADITTLLVKIITASEIAVDHRDTASKAGKAGAIARWGNRTDAELEPITLPEIIIPAGLSLPTFQSGGVEIRPGEYLQTIEAFLIRGYEPEQHLAFYGYYDKKRWQDGTIGTAAARLNRVLRWNQLDGPKRFESDPAAHALFLELLNALPAEKRVYLLGDGVRVIIDKTDHICVYAPKDIRGDLKSLTAAKTALESYRNAHRLTNDKWGFVAIPFQIKTRK